VGSRSSRVPGYIPLILAGLAVLLRRGRRVGLFLVLAVACFSIGSGRGVGGPWLDILASTWLSATSRSGARHSSDGLCPGCPGRPGAGFDCSARWTSGAVAWRGVWRGLVWFCAAAILIGGAWAYLVIYQAQDRDPTLFWRVSAAEVGYLGAADADGEPGVLRARRSGWLKRRVLAVLAVGLVFVDLASLGAYTDLGEEPPTSGFDHPQIVEFLQNDPGLFRIDSRTDVWDVWQPDLALLPGCMTSAASITLSLLPTWPVTGGDSGRSTRLYDLMGARYVLAAKTSRSTGPSFPWPLTAIPR